MGCTKSRSVEILVLVGSARRNSVHEGIVEEIKKFIIEKDITLKLVIPALDKLPIFNCDIESQICSNPLMQFCRIRSYDLEKKLVLQMLSSLSLQK